MTNPAPEALIPATVSVEQLADATDAIDTWSEMRCRYAATENAHGEAIVENCLYGARVILESLGLYDLARYATAARTAATAPAPPVTSE